MPENTEILLGFRNILKYYDVLRRRVCKTHGLSQTEFDVLAFLCNNPGLDTARDIVELRRIPKSNVSVAVDSLMQKNLLQRYPDAKDRRRIHLQPTVSAQAVLSDVQSVLPQFMACAFDGFTDQEIRQFEQFYLRMSQRIAQCLQKEGTPHA